MTLSIDDRFFLGRTRLLRGSWQAFERDVARLFLQNGFDQVRIVGGPGDKGGDILAVKKCQLWVVQCKHTTTGPAPFSAVQEVLDAGEYYSADRLLVATSRLASDSLKESIRRQRALGVAIELAEPERLATWLEASPEFPPTISILRPYQEEAVEKLIQSLIDTGHGQIVLATGLGKTVVLAEMASRMLREGQVRGSRVLVVAHTRPLVDQLIQAFWRQLPKTVHTHRLTGQEFPTYWDGITFATIQTIAEEPSGMPDFGLVIVDEAHHIGAATFQKMIRSLRPPMLAGATATPWRGDGYDIDRVLGPALVKIGISEGLQGGFLSEVDYRLLADNLDWEFIQRASRMRYSLSQLNRRLIIPRRDDEAARMIAETYAHDRRHSGIVYCPSTEHANSFAATLRQYGFKAEPIQHEIPPREFARTLARFRNGEIHFVTVVDMFNEGVDVPDVDMIIFMRVSHSRRIFVQQLGRGLRVSRGKNRVVVLDFVTDLRRMAEVIQLDQAVKGGDIERLGLGASLVAFSDHSAGSFLKEWMLDQASLFLREGDPSLQVPNMDFPSPAHEGAID